MIDTVVFDLGGVLVDWNPRYLFRKVFSDETKMEHFLTNVCNGEWNEKQDAGRPFAEALAEIKNQHPDYYEFAKIYWDRWPETLGKPIQETVEILKQVKAAGYRTLALSNWSAETFPYALQRFDFLHWFDGRIISGEDKLIKPDRAIYDLLLKRFAVDVSKAVFIDDVPRNVTGAEAAGIKAVRFENPQLLKTQLKTLLPKLN